MQKTLIFVDTHGSDELQHGISKNLISGFSATGIVPFNPDKVLSIVSGYRIESDDRESINNPLISFLKIQRFGEGSTTNCCVKRKQLVNISRIRNSC